MHHETKIGTATEQPQGRGTTRIVLGDIQGGPPIHLPTRRGAGAWGGSTFPERGGGFAHKVPVARNIAESGQI